MQLEGKEFVERQYQKVDPWDYMATPDYATRIQQVVNSLSKRYLRAVDIGCGEGWTTKYLPAEYIYGYDLSDTAMSRLPENVKPLSLKELQEQKFDLVVAMGMIYPHYDPVGTVDLINKIATDTIVTCHLKDVEDKYILNIKGTMTERTFPYEHTYQVLRVFTLW